MILSDFCMAPTDNAISLSETAVEDMAYYYGTCNGTNPMYAPLSLSVDATTSLAATVTTLTEDGGACEDNPYLLATVPFIVDIFLNVSHIEEASDCSWLQQVWAKLHNETFCNSYFIAIYSLFWTLTCVLVSHFILMITSSLISQYFNQYWHTGDLVDKKGPATLNDNIVHGVEQLQPDGTLTLSAPVMDMTSPIEQIHYFDYSHNHSVGQETLRESNCVDIQMTTMSGDGDGDSVDSLSQEV